MVQVPVEIWLGKHHGLDLLVVIAVQLAWTVTLGLAGRAVMGRAERRVVVQGG
jgi:ABC-2 type transport system permease protein